MLLAFLYMAFSLSHRSYPAAFESSAVLRTAIGSELAPGDFVVLLNPETSAFLGHAFLHAPQRMHSGEFFMV
jgi:hypothetical protein